MAGGRFVHGRTDLPELVWRETDGAIRQIVRWKPQRSYPTDAHWDAFVDGVRREYGFFMSADEAELSVQRSLERIEINEDKPVPLYMQLHGDRDGGLWLATYVSAASLPFMSVPSYDVVDPDGVWLGKLEVPPGFMLLDVAGDRLLGVVKGEFDVESIAVYQLDIVPLRH